MLTLVQSSFVRYESDCIARNFEYSLRDASRSNIDVRYYFDRAIDEKAHVVTRDQYEIDAQMHRVLATASLENYCSSMIAKYRDQSKCIARAYLNSNEVDFDVISHFSYVRREIRYTHVIHSCMSAEYDSAYDLSLESDLQISRDSHALAEKCLRYLNELRKIISRFSRISTIDQENSILRVREIAEFLQFDFDIIEEAQLYARELVN